MFQQNELQIPYSLIGNIGPFFIPRSDPPKIVRPGKDYFFVQIHSAQAAFYGSIWDNVQNLVVASMVKMKHRSLDQDGLRSIQRTCSVQKNMAQPLGMSPNLISLVPAVMPEFSISIDFILDIKNNLFQLSQMINDDSFLATISLAPGTAMVAKTISGLADKIIQQFVPPQQQKPILQFSRDFNLAGGNLQEGYYVFLGTKDPRNAFPEASPRIQIKNGECRADGKPITQWSYVVLDVRCTPLRTRDFNDGALWYLKLCEAEDESSRIGFDSLDGPRKDAWEKCKNLIKEAQTLLRNDTNYLRDEAESIIRDCLIKCSNSLGIETKASPSTVVRRVGRGGWQPNMRAERAYFDIKPDEDLETAQVAYQEKTNEALEVLREAKLIT